MRTRSAIGSLATAGDANDVYLDSSLMLLLRVSVNDPPQPCYDSQCLGLWVARPPARPPARRPIHWFILNRDRPLAAFDQPPPPPLLFYGITAACAAGAIDSPQTPHVSGKLASGLSCQSISRSVTNHMTSMSHTVVHMIRYRVYCMQLRI